MTQTHNPPFDSLIELLPEVVHSEVQRSRVSIAIGQEAALETDGKPRTIADTVEFFLWDKYVKCNHYGFWASRMVVQNATDIMSRSDVMSFLLNICERLKFEMCGEFSSAIESVGHYMAVYLEERSKTPHPGNLMSLDNENMITHVPTEIRNTCESNPWFAIFAVMMFRPTLFGIFNEFDRLVLDNGLNFHIPKGKPDVT